METLETQAAPVLAGLRPERVFHFFEEMTRIPHGSGNTRAVSDWAANFARERNLRFAQDGAGNVAIWKDASPGMEDRPTVILQGHLDMVCVRDPGVDHDFTRDPLSLAVEDGCVRAGGTTLGADDGIAVAMAMAVLEDDSLVHPPLAALFTVDEEIGMLGAAKLDIPDLTGSYLLNMDSEGEGVLTVGCAGGMRCQLSLHMSTAPVEGTVCTLRLTGLSGGHSGALIHRGLGNASRLMAQCLEALGCPSLVSLAAGEQDNAIPDAATAVVVLPEGRAEECKAAAEAWVREARTRCPNDPGLALTVESAPGRAEAVSSPDCRRMAELILALPDGVQAMSRDLPGQVETSLNLGITRMENGQLLLASLLRSSVLGSLRALGETVRTVAGRFDAAFSTEGCYPPWEYRQDSHLRDTMVAVYRALYGEEPKVETIHAGLECGVLVSKLPGLDAVSFGPNMYDIHSPRERLEIASVQRTWNYLLEILKLL